MERKTVYVIIIISSLALLGIFFTQIYWVKESFRLKEEQFANSVRIALKGVAYQMLNYELAQMEKRHDTSLHSQVPVQGGCSRRNEPTHQG